jgi:hypothetical protein
MIGEGEDSQPNNTIADGGLNTEGLDERIFEKVDQELGHDTKRGAMNKTMLVGACIIGVSIVAAAWLNNYLSPHQTCVRSALSIPYEGKAIESKAAWETRAHQWCWKQNDPH